MRPFAKLRRGSRLFCIVLLGCSSVLGTMLMWDYWKDAANASVDARNLRRTTAVVKALNAISAERGPTNALVSAHADRSDLVSSLAASRHASDRAVSRIDDDRDLADGVATLRRSLRDARSTVDAIVAKPLEKRTIADIDQAVAVMVAVIDGAGPLLDETARTAASRPLSNITGSVMAIRALSDMRDYAGRMGSALMMPLALKQPITQDQRAAYESARGRVFGLWRLAGGALPLDGDAAVQTAADAVETQFLVGGIGIFQSVLEAGRDGVYPFDRETFTANLQPGFRTLQALRDAVADRALHRVEAEGRHAQWAFVVVAAATFVMVGLECFLILAAQKLIFHPLFDAREAILDLAEGRLERLPKHPNVIGEVGELFDALTLLKQQIRQRDTLDRENRHLTAQLRDLADRDGLTGALNRGAIERIMQDREEADSGPQTLGLILFDIDHFKAINDRHGHASGDTVLRLLAARWRDILPAGADFTRYGGEEFAVTMADVGLPHLRQVAERLRRAAASTPVTLPSGIEVSVSASFGVAVASRSPGVWAALIEAADRALYRVKRSGRNAVSCESDETAEAMAI